MFSRIAFFTLLAGAAAAQDYPRLHDVSGVASDDTLNLREAPSAKAPVVGELAHDARAIEVMRVENGWGRVNIKERAGWASIRYLAPRADGDLPNAQALTCFGTEPFWSLHIRPGQTAQYRSPEVMDGETYGVGPLQRLWSPTLKYTLRGEGGEGSLDAMIMPAYCDDGMSDREYGFDVTLFLSREDRVYSGCCTLDE
ncbi:COG3650 family protein [Ponticoccus sp. (in: a-proteobacteria)]|uniref:COG3650 family protein n=1 Tax=Ponticoccus sp. (in: a-proteobacteria) TaxID=1925025 RepID=UPI003AB6050D